MEQSKIIDTLETYQSLAEFLMDGMELRGPSGYTDPRDGHVGTSRDNDNQGDEHSPRHEPYVPQALTQEQSDELRRRNEQALRTHITGTTPKALAMESVRLATLAERDRLEQLQRELDDRARQQPSSSRHKCQLFPSDQPWKYQVLNTPLQILAAYHRFHSALRFRGRGGDLPDPSPPEDTLVAERGSVAIP